MIQTPIQQAQQIPQYSPSYNAVKIDIHNPQVNAPGYTQNPVQPNYTSELYGYPNAPVYEVPKKSVYSPEPKKEMPPMATPPIAVMPVPVREVPIVPPPIIMPQAAPAIAQAAATPVAPTPVKTEVKPVAVETKPIEKKNEPSVKEEKAAEPQKVDVKTADVIKPDVDINEIISKLSNPDYEVQASTMESIAKLVHTNPEKATELLDVKVVDTLLGIMQQDTSKLQGPSQNQMAIREKLIEGKQVSDAEKAEAMIETPMEKAEENKQYAIYTVAVLQKLYSSEIKKLNNTTVPLTELPGAAGVVEQVKNNPNPMVRVAGLEALSYIQCPEYKKDLTTIFSIAQNDSDNLVKKVATKALSKLEQVETVATEPKSVVDTKTQTPSESAKKAA